MGPYNTALGNVRGMLALGRATFNAGAIMRVMSSIDNVVAAKGYFTVYEIVCFNAVQTASSSSGLCNIFWAQELIFCRSSAACAFGLQSGASRTPTILLEVLCGNL